MVKTFFQHCPNNRKSRNQAALKSLRSKSHILSHLSLSLKLWSLKNTIITFATFASFFVLSLLFYDFTGVAMFSTSTALHLLLIAMNVINQRFLVNLKFILYRVICCYPFNLLIVQYIKYFLQNVHCGIFCSQYSLTYSNFL